MMIKLIIFQMVKDIVDKHTSLLSILFKHKVNNSLILDIWREWNIGFHYFHQYL